MHRFVLVLRRNDSSHFDDRLLSLAIAKYKQVLMKLEDKLRSAEDVSAANGFARETNISDLWKSLFDEEAGEATHEVIKDRILSELFQPILGESWHREIQTLPVYSPYNYILGSVMLFQNFSLTHSGYIYNKVSLHV